MMDGATEAVYRSHRFTVADFLRMDQSGLFDSALRVELLEGELIDTAPIGSPHAAAVTFLQNRLIECLGTVALVRIQCPVVLDDFSAPQPDLAVVRRRRDLYRGNHPRPDDILLLIEVADTSLALDRDKKMPLYARAGVAELWIMDVERSTFHVFREPVEGVYRSRQVLIEPNSINIGAFPDIVIDLSSLNE